MSKESIREALKELTAELKTMEAAEESNEFISVLRGLEDCTKRVKAINERAEYRRAKAERAEAQAKKAKQDAAKRNKAQKEKQAEHELASKAATGDKAQVKVTESAPATEG